MSYDDQRQKSWDAYRKQRDDELYYEKFWCELSDDGAHPLQRPAPSLDQKLVELEREKARNWIDKKMKEIIGEDLFSKFKRRGMI